MWRPLCFHFIFEMKKKLIYKMVCVEAMLTHENKALHTHHKLIEFKKNVKKKEKIKWNLRKSVCVCVCVCTHKDHFDTTHTLANTRLAQMEEPTFCVEMQVRTLQRVKKIKAILILKKQMNKTAQGTLGICTENS